MTTTEERLAAHPRPGARAAAQRPHDRGADRQSRLHPPRGARRRRDRQDRARRADRLPRPLRPVPLRHHPRQRLRGPGQGRRRRRAAAAARRTARRAGAAGRPTPTSAAGDGDRVAPLRPHVLRTAAAGDDRGALRPPAAHPRRRRAAGAPGTGPGRRPPRRPVPRRRDQVLPGDRRRGGRREGRRRRGPVGRLRAGDAAAAHRRRPRPGDRLARGGPGLPPRLLQPAGGEPRRRPPAAAGAAPPARPDGPPRRPARRACRRHCASTPPTRPRRCAPPWPRPRPGTPRTAWPPASWHSTAATRRTGRPPRSGAPSGRPSAASTPPTTVLALAAGEATPEPEQAEVARLLRTAAELRAEAAAAP